MSMLSMQYAGTLLGRDAVIDFPDSRAEVRYSSQGKMRWRVGRSLIRKLLSESCAMLDSREPRPKHSWPGDMALYPCVMLRMWMPH